MFPFGFLVRLQQPYVAGFHRHGGTAIYVSRGTGYWGPPMRLGAPAEITEIEALDVLSRSHRGGDLMRKTAPVEGAPLLIQRHQRGGRPCGLDHADPILSRAHGSPAKTLPALSNGGMVRPLLVNRLDPGGALDTLVDPVEMVSSSHMRAAPRADGPRASLPSIDPEAQVQWFSRVGFDEEEPISTVDIIEISWDEESEPEPTLVLQQRRLQG